MSRFRVPILVLLTLFCFPLMGVATASAKSNARPTAHISPYKVGIGRPATLIASHLPAGKLFTLLLAVPNPNSPRISQFIPKLPKSDGKGNLKVHFTMPIVPFCGKAVVSVFTARTATAVRVPVYLTGCTPSKSTNAPPPPPSHSGKKKKP